MTNRYLLSFTSFLFLLLFSAKVFAQNGLQIVEGPLDIIPCDSNCTMIHANFPKPLKTNQYATSTVPFAPISITGTAINLADDKFSNAIPIGFNFCFFENVYTQCYVSDNGILTFNPAFNGANCNNNTQQLLPYFNSTFPDNAVFFLYMDVNPTLGGSISYATIGTAPFRKLVIKYQNMKIFGATCSNLSSSYQVILYETTNIIEVHVTNKTTCDGNPANYSNYATIGVQNIGATTAFTVPGKHASVFTMSNEAVRIAPSGPLNYLLVWKDANLNTIATNVDSIHVCPPTFPYSKIRATITFYCPTATYKDSVIINKITPHIDSLTVIKPQCNGDSSGSITVHASGANPPFTYAIGNGPFTSNNNFPNLTTGNYYFTVKDANGCKKDTLVNLTPQYNVYAYIDSIKNPTCPDSNGKIYIHAGNGVPPYSIVWGNGATTWSLTGLTAGVYMATVTDANGCSNFAYITLHFDGLPVLQNIMTKPHCHDSLGSIQVIPTGGTSPYHYLWTNGDTTATTGLIPAGQYGVTVTDSHGCSTNSVYVLVDTLATSTWDTVLHNTTCNLSNGSALVLAGLGLPPYTYNWMPGGQNTATAVGLAAGTYVCTTTDANNCVKKDTVVILPSVGMINIVSKANANCDSSNGKIYLNNVLNHTGWVDTLWSNGNTSGSITGLAPGTYWVKTTDSIGCVKTDTITLLNDGKPYLGLVTYTPPLCFGDSSGSITLTGSSGTAPYKYSVDGINFTSFAQINNIAGGTYTIYITDANSCPHDTIVFFTQPSQIISNYTADTVICYNDKTSTLAVSTTGGFLPYLYSMNGGNYTTQHIFNQLTQGDYTVVVKDSNNCLQTLIATVPGPASPFEVIVDKKDVPCFETNTGYVKLTLQGGWIPYMYTWSNAVTTLEQLNLGETNLSFHAEDDRGCVVDKDIFVQQLLCCKAVVPNAFSPNNDTKNDVLKVIPISEVQSIKFSIFDRWGKNIFSTKNLQESWDGTYLGKDCDVDVYFYYLEYNCPFQKEKVIQKGDITLIR